MPVQFNIRIGPDPPLSNFRSQGALTFSVTKSLFPGALSLNHLTESWRKVQKQPSTKVILGKVVLEISIKFTGEHLCRSAISIKLQSNFIEIKLWHRCSHVNLLHIFRTAFYRNTYEGLLLKVAFKKPNALRTCLFKNTLFSLPVIYAIFLSCSLEKV